MSMEGARVERTYAFVVGIEEYDGGWNLDGPANDVRRFIGWLRGWDVPAGNIHLFLSPLKENAFEEVDGVKVAGPARREAISKGITETLRKIREGDLLFIFWGGHGIATAAGTRLLLYSDATGDAMLNLNLNDLLAFLRTDYFSGLPRRQICIVDACASFLSNQPFKTPSETFPSGEPVKGMDQMVLMSAKPGEASRNVTARKTGLFSEALLNRLEAKSDGVWPPDMQSIAGELQEQFQEMRGRGEAKQTPSRLWYRSEDDEWDYSTGHGQGKQFAGGAGAYLLCDRKKEEGEFTGFLNEQLMGNAQAPMACIIHGNKAERHGSLVLRLIDKVIRPMVESDLRKSSRRNGEPFHGKIGWMDESDPKRFQRLFLPALFHEVDPEYVGELSIPQFVRLRPLQGTSVIVLQHDIEEGGWSRENVEWYLEGWRQHRDAPRVIIFMNIIYNDTDDLWARTRTLIRKRLIRKDLEKIRAFPGLRCLVLPELESPKATDVNAWLEKQKVSDFPEEISQLCDRICGNAPVTMAHVENELLKIYRNHTTGTFGQRS